MPALTGVRAVATVRVAPEDLPPPTVYEGDFPPNSLASCADIARTPDFGRCEPGAEVAWVSPDLRGTTVWPAAQMTTDELRELPMQSIVVSTDGSRAAIERSRTVLGAAFPMRWGPITEAEWQADTARVFNGWKQLANVVVVAGLVIAGCSLAAGVAGGLSDRKRPFSHVAAGRYPARPAAPGGGAGELGAAAGRGGGREWELSDRGDGAVRSRRRADLLRLSRALGRRRK